MHARTHQTPYLAVCPSVSLPSQRAQTLGGHQVQSSLATQRGDVQAWSRVRGKQENVRKNEITKRKLAGEKRLSV